MIAEGEGRSLALDNYCKIFKNLTFSNSTFEENHLHIIFKYLKFALFCRNINSAELVLFRFAVGGGYYILKISI